MYGTELLRRIYIEEQWWDRLIEMLKHNGSLYEIKQNEKYLSPKYNGALLELYETGLILYLKKNVGRNHYQNACIYLRRMKKLGGSNRVNQLISDFRIKYVQRRALLDELSRV